MGPATLYCACHPLHDPSLLFHQPPPCLAAWLPFSVDGLYCVGDSTFPGQGVNAVVFSGFGCAHRVAVDLGMAPGWPVVDSAYRQLLGWARDSS